jgi:hypothetical protein
MWLITTDGFLSIVQNLNFTGTDDDFLVCARARTDLERIVAFAKKNEPADGDRVAWRRLRLRTDHVAPDPRVICRGSGGRDELSEFKNEIARTDSWQPSEMYRTAQGV